MLIRAARPTDAGAIAKVNVESWRTAYAGIIPADFLAGLSIEQRASRWREILANPDSRRFNLVAETGDGQIAGFASGGPDRDDHPLYPGELYAIYLLPAQWRQGLGRRLATAVAARLWQQGLSSMLVWVLADNQPARAFYQALGGQLLDHEKELSLGGATLIEVAYGWLDIRALAGGL